MADLGDGYGRPTSRARSAFIGNAFLVFLYHATPRLAGRPVTSLERWGWALFFVITSCLPVIPGWAPGHGLVGPEWIEWAEFPIITDAFAISFGLCLGMAGQFVIPLLRARLSELYISAWYISGERLSFTALAYPGGELRPRGRQRLGATYSGIRIHDAVSVSTSRRSPWRSHTSSSRSRPAGRSSVTSACRWRSPSWMLFFVYPLNGTHHHVFSSIPHGRTDRCNRRLGLPRHGRPSWQRDEPSSPVDAVPPVPWSATCCRAIPGWELSST